jgi:hypothetical protein
MSDREWLTSDDSAAMLRAVRPRAAERKLRLFACACARLVWDRLPPGLLREAVEAGEAAADGVISDDERQAYIPRLYSPWGQPDRPPSWFGGRPFAEASKDDWAGFYAAKLAVAPGQVLAKLPGGLGWAEAARLTGPRQPGLLRDVFGPAAAQPSAFDPAWRTPDAVTLAGHVYHDRAFTDLPDLANALEAAGCRDPAVLSHCRAEGPHVRGCWVVDLILGRE